MQKCFVSYLLTEVLEEPEVLLATLNAVVTGLQSSSVYRVIFRRYIWIESNTQKHLQFIERSGGNKSIKPLFRP